MRRNKEVSEKIGKVWFSRIILTLNFVEKPTNDWDIHLRVFITALEMAKLYSSSRLITNMANTRNGCQTL